jgi:hypothetical protein
MVVGCRGEHTRGRLRIFRPGIVGTLPDLRNPESLSCPAASALWFLPRPSPPVCPCVAARLTVAAAGLDSRDDARARPNSSGRRPGPQADGRDGRTSGGAMTAWHRELAAGRWVELSLAEQLGNVGSEVSRALSWEQRGNAEHCARAVERARAARPHACGCAAPRAPQRACPRARDPGRLLLRGQPLRLIPGQLAQRLRRLRRRGPRRSLAAVLRAITCLPASTSALALASTAAF